MARVRRNCQTEIPQQTAVRTLRNRVILENPALTFVHHIHREGVCFVWNVGEQEYYATREWEFITPYEQSLVDSFVFSLQLQSFIP